MLKAIIGAAAAALAMLVLSYIVHATPIAGMGFGNVTVDQAAQLQSNLNLHLGETGSYRVPDPNTAEQSALYAQGPIATIHYSTAGEANAAISTMRFAYALILNFLVAMTIAAAMIGLVRVSDFGARARLGVLFAFAATALVHLSRPIWLHHDWSNALFAFVTDGLILAAGAAIVAWFIPRQRDRAPREAPTEV